MQPASLTDLPRLADEFARCLKAELTFNWDLDDTYDAFQLTARAYGFPDWESLKSGTIQSPSNHAELRQMLGRFEQILRDALPVRRSAIRLLLQATSPFVRDPIKGPPQNDAEDATDFRQIYPGVIARLARSDGRSLPRAACAAKALLAHTDLCPRYDDKLSPGPVIRLGTAHRGSNEIEIFVCDLPAPGPEPTDDEIYTAAEDMVLNRLGTETAGALLLFNDLLFRPAFSEPADFGGSWIHQPCIYAGRFLHAGRWFDRSLTSQKTLSALGRRLPARLYDDYWRSNYNSQLWAAFAGGEQAIAAWVAAHGGASQINHAPLTEAINLWQRLTPL